MRRQSEESARVQDAIQREITQDDGEDGMWIRKAVEVAQAGLDWTVWLRGELWRQRGENIRLRDDIDRKMTEWMDFEEEEEGENFFDILF